MKFRQTKKLLALLMAALLIMSTGIISAFASDKERSGDIDGDGFVSASDARSILRLSVNLVKCIPVIEQYADTDGNGKVTAADARLALRVSVKLDNEDSLATFVPEEDDGYFYPDITEITLTEGEKAKSDVLVRKGMDVSITSTNPEAATISENGEITAVSKGFSCIIIECEDYKFYIEVNVKTPLQEKIDTLRNKYPDGYYWNNHEPSKKYPAVTETPCSDHREEKWAYCKGQCAGFAALMYDEVFGKKAVKNTGVTWDTLKVGDYIRFSGHSVFVIDVVKEGDITGYSYYAEENITASRDYIVVVHCNWHWNCDIVWDGIFYFDSYTILPGYSYTAY